MTTTDTRVYGPYGVLFLCTGNSARSIMAEAILNRVGRGAFHAYSAGSHPTGQVHPYTLDLLRNLDFDVSPLRSKSGFEFTGPNGPELDFVFTVCDDPIELCPIWPGQPMTAQWGVPDPAAAEGTEAERRLAFADAFRMLSNRINIFVSLPLRSLSAIALQPQLDAIGKSTPAMSDPYSVFRRWLDRLSTRTTVMVAIVVIAIALSVIVWG